MADRNDELESLRSQIRLITRDIMQKVQQRIELASKVGEVKSRLGIDVRDERVEQEIRLMVLKNAREIGMSSQFALRLLDVLLKESESVQERKRKAMQEKMTHLGIFQKAKQMEASGKRIIHLEVGEPDYPPPAQVGVALAESFALKKYHYTDTRGTLQLRQAIAKKCGVTDDRVIVTPGGRFAVFAAIASLVQPGEELITIEPAWPAYRECASFAGARTRALKTTLESGWTPDLKELESMVNEGTKMIALNYPNNPTGKVLDKKTMDRIMSIAKEHGLHVLSDEVYADYSFAPFESTLAYGYDKTIVVSSFSKTYAMTGFRVGYAVAGADVIKKMSRVQAAGITSVAEPIQHAALAALGQDASGNSDMMKSRLRFLSKKLKEEMSLSFVEPDGAMYVYPRLPKGSDDMDIVEKLLEKGVAIAPGSGFGDSYGKFVRISACRPESEIAEGLAIMSSVLGKA
ncbi:MAG: aminotransferase class I/II-fold pyridoxal phosphate-dependent enzyme [Nitrososphaera sp.]